MKTLLSIIIITLLFLNIASSQTAYDAVRIRLNEMGFGARTLAMGGNGVADVTGEFSHLRFSNNATFSNTISDQSSNYTKLRNFGMVFPFATDRGSLVFAMGYNHV